MGEAATGTIAIGGAGLLVIVPMLVAGGIGWFARGTHPVAGYALLSAAAATAAVVIVVQETVSEAFTPRRTRHFFG